MERRFLVLPVRSLEIMLTELPGPHDREQITFIGWSWPVARSTGSLLYLPNVATSHRLHKHTVVKFHLLFLSFLLSPFFFILLLSVSFSVILLFVWRSFFPVFCYSFAPYTYEIS